MDILPGTIVIIGPIKSRISTYLSISKIDGAFSNEMFKNYLELLSDR